jgi:hypothetical protein
LLLFVNQSIKIVDLFIFLITYGMQSLNKGYYLPLFCTLYSLDQQLVDFFRMALK